MELINRDQLFAMDLGAEYDDRPGGALYVARVGQRAVEVLWYDDDGRGGVSDGGDSVWGDAATVEDLVRYATTDYEAAARQATDLSTLCDVMLDSAAASKSIGSDVQLDWTDLPVFGGEEPLDTRRVWSWDEDSLLVGTCANNLRIVPRVEWDQAQ